MMSMLPPSRPPAVDVKDNDGLNRLQLRLWQVLMTSLTLAVSGWFWSMGVVPGILSIFITKHVLVAILVVGMTPPRTSD